MKLHPLSKSTWERFTRCPWHAHAVKNLGFEDEAGPAAIWGQQGHTYLERWLLGESIDDILTEVQDDEAMQSCLLNAVTLSPFTEGLERRVEAHVMVTKTGKRTDAKQSAALQGYLDVVEPHPELNEVLVVDWKFGQWIKDNVFERHSYAGLLAPALCPNYRRFRFQLRFLRTNTVLESLYTFSDDGKELEIISPDGDILHMNDPKGPTIAWLQANMARVRRTGPIPTPGKHCENWFGRPCRFLGYECPLSMKLPAIINESLNLKEHEQIAKSFNALREKKTPISKDNVGRAWLAVTALKQVIGTVEAQVKEWSREYGPFSVGDKKIGWKSKAKYEINKPFVLEALMDSEMTYDEIAEIVSINKTNIEKKIPKEYAELKDTILSFAVKQLRDEMFGEIKEKKEGDE